MKKQFIVSKYVMADSLEEAVRKSRKTPIHEAYIHNSWLEKRNYEFFPTEAPSQTGFGEKKK